MSKLNSKINKFFDSVKFDKYRTLRKEIFFILNTNKNNLYDYGEGYFYQSLEKISLSGLRLTQKRIETLDLNNYIKDKTILDIGSNIGAISLQLDQTFNSFDNIEHNNILNKIGQKISNVISNKQINFYSEDFMEKKFTKNYDIILSLANHHTFDGGIKNTDLYFEKILNILKKNGILIVESHHPKYENEEKFQNIINQILKKDLITIKKGSYKFYNNYDYRRSFYFLKKL